MPSVSRKARLVSRLENPFALTDRVALRRRSGRVDCWILLRHTWRET